MVVDPFRPALALMRSRQVSANPNTGIRQIIERPSLRIWIVTVNRGSPVNRNSTDDQAQKQGDIQPMAGSYEHVMSARYKHARLWRRRACSDPIMELRARWHKYSPRYCREVMPFG